MTVIDRRHFLYAGLAGALISGRSGAQDNSVQQEPWSSGGLFGTFARPREAGRRPAALIIAGSGPTPRDGTVGTYRQIAEGLAAGGIASLRYDKRGVGESRSLVTREDDVVLGNFVDDAVAAVRSLSARPDVSAVFILGHSEGALIGTLAAAKVPVAGLVLLAGMGRRFDVVLREQLTAVSLPAAQEPMRQRALDILAKLARGERVDDVPQEHMVLFRPSVQPFLLSLMAVDPAAELAKLKTPTLLVRGASDIQISAADLDALAKARPDARVLRLPATNHVLKPAPADISDRAAQLASYKPDAPLAPGLMPVLVSFVGGAKL
jgi:pimeloyl-ACP methyl ester carboxylesterase